MTRAPSDNEDPVLRATRTSRSLLDRFPPHATCLPILNETEEADHLDALDDWVTWLTDRYQLDHRVIPPCWTEHGALLEELSALRSSWLHSYQGSATGDAPLNWHADFWHTRQRLTDWAARTGCRPGEHRP